MAFKNQSKTVKRTPLTPQQLAEKALFESASDRAKTIGLTLSRLVTRTGKRTTKTTYHLEGNYKRSGANGELEFHLHSEYSHLDIASDLITSLVAMAGIGG